jgi:hypothetical protein
VFAVRLGHLHISVYLLLFADGRVALGLVRTTAFVPPVPVQWALCIAPEKSPHFYKNTIFQPVPKVSVEWLALPVHTQEVHGSNLSPGPSILLQDCCGFRSLLQTK